MLKSSPDAPRLVPALGSLGGQPRKDPPADAALHIRSFAGDGFSIVGIAEKFGIERKTLDRWLDDFQELREAFDRGREKERHTLHNRLFRIAMESDDEKAASIAAMFLLKSRHGYREGDPGDQANRVSITFSLPGALTLEQFAEVKNATPVIEISGTSLSDTRSA
jgi:transposase-like protein